jgi:hypothetical protein
MLPLVRAESGTLHVSETPDETLSLLGLKPAAWRCILQWQGHDGDAATYGSSKVGRIAIIIQTARGMRADRGADAHKAPVVPGAANERPILELVSLVGQWVRSLLFQDGEGQLRDDIEHIKSNGRRQCFSELSGDWLEFEDVDLPARQYQTTFSIRYADAATEDDVEVILIATQTTMASIVQREIPGDGERLAFSHADIRRVYIAFLNGVAVPLSEVSLSGPTATFTVAPQPGDTVMLLGAL